MTRLLSNPRFWVLAVVLVWLVLITVLIAVEPPASPEVTGQLSPAGRDRVP